MRTRAKSSESGYVLLFVFALSAIMAIGLYQQLPRAAFENQREKESLLINHGEQYKRAVQLYCRKMGRYPAKMEDLDNTQNIRFLRKHYFDPMTGKDEWRLLHMGPNGKLIDSKIPAADPNKDQWHAGSITEFKSAASSDDSGPEAVNLATRKRPSDDQTLAPMGSAPPPDPAAQALQAQLNSTANPGSNPSNPAGGNPGANGANGTPGMPQVPQVPAWLNGGALPGMPPGARGLTLPPGAPTSVPNQSSSSPGGSVSGNGGYGSSIAGNGGFGNSSSPLPIPTPPNPNQQAGGFGAPVNSQYQGQSPTSTFPNGFANNNGSTTSFNGNNSTSPYPTAPGSNSNPSTGFGNPGNNMSPGQMINNLLTNPRPGGMPTGAGMPGIGGTVIGGLAGVATTYRGHGIKRYNDQDEYQKWEFYYDLGQEVNKAAGIVPSTPTQNNIPFGGGAGNVGTPPPPPTPPQPQQMSQ